MEVSKVELVALGLLADEPAHGYELLERGRALGMEVWADAGKASVYQALRRLESEGAISSRVQDGAGGPDRRVYRIARGGRDRLRRGVLERLGSPDREEAASALGLVHRLSSGDAKDGLAAHDAALRERLEAVEEERPRVAAQRGPFAAVAARMLEREEALLRADLAWLGSFRRGISRLAK